MGVGRKERIHPRQAPGVRLTGVCACSAALEQAYNGLEEWRARTADGVEVVGYYLPPPERAK